MDVNEEFYERFKKQLENAHNFPEEYTFKFIVDNKTHNLAKIYKIFDTAEPQFSTKDSSKGNYTSLTVTVYVLDADSVINYYKEVSKLEGVSML